MKPKDIIEMLASAENKKGKLWFSTPMTNIPIGKNDNYAGKFMLAMNEIMPAKATVKDYMEVFMEVFWWLIFFGTVSNDEAFELNPYPDLKQ